MPVKDFALWQFETWAPFKVDALGLVTLLGAQEIDLALGQLTWSTLAEWLPMLASYIIANNRVTEPLPGFTVYNITDGIMAMDLAGWFSRWLLCENVTFCSTTVHIQTASAGSFKRHRRLRSSICAYCFGMMTLIPAILGILIGDWWGLANGIAIIASVVVRQVILSQNRLAIDGAVDSSEKLPDENVKILITMPNGKVVTVHTTRGVLINCLLTHPRPPNAKLYSMTRCIGWIAFGVHIISLGMACLLSQILTVALLIAGTILAAGQIGTDRRHVGRKIVLDCTKSDVPFRAATYANLDLTPKQEDSMVLWNLFPHRSNKLWWLKYRDAKSRGSFTSWDSMISNKEE